MKSFMDEPFFQDREETPWKWSFFHLCRWTEAHVGPLPKIGEDAHPANEYFRLGQTPSTIFAPREIVALNRRYGRLHVQLAGLGLYGPNGPLPLHMTEEVHERNLQKRDSTLMDFLDMFHHRWLSLFYRAWAIGQPTTGLDRKDDERFSMYVASLMGHDNNGLHKDAIPSHARLASVGHLVIRSRYPAGLAATCSHFWQLPFRVEEYHFHWLKLEAAEQSRLGRLGLGHVRSGGEVRSGGDAGNVNGNRTGRLYDFENQGRPCGFGNQGRPCRLGHNAVLGSHVPDRQSMFVLHAGPLTLEEYKRFLPTGEALPALTDWVREFVGIEFFWKLSLTLHSSEVPLTQLGGRAQLGRTTWLARTTSPGQPEKAFTAKTSFSGSSGMLYTGSPLSESSPSESSITGLVFSGSSGLPRGPGGSAESRGSAESGGSARSEAEAVQGACFSPEHVMGKVL